MEHRSFTMLRSFVVVGILAVALCGFAFLLSSPEQAVVGETVNYGGAPSAFGQIFVPEGATSLDAALPPVVVLYHGGFWRRRGGDLSLMTPLAERLVGEGYAVWNVEYGRSGERFGGWPHTFDHVRESIDYIAELADVYAIDEERVVLVGHSAGGHLALWGATQLSDDQTVVLRGVVALAPIVDIDAAVRDGLGNNSVVDLMGGTPSELPGPYAAVAVADQGEFATIVITSDVDDSVSLVYSAGVQGMNVTEVQLAGLGHLELIRPDGLAADALIEGIAEILAHRE